MDEFGKKFTLKDINSFKLTKEKESNRREFKSGHELEKLYRKDIKKEIKDNVKDNIAKDVSSFANSSGGIIVYGIQTKEDRADKIVTFDATQITPETLEKIIDSRIEKKVKYRIDTVEVDNDIEKSIYVIIIPASADAPHMVCEKYYRRYNFKSVPMQEYEVRSLYAKREKTELGIVEPVVKIIEGQPVSHNPNQVYSAIVSIYIMAKNMGNTIEKIYSIECTVPTMCSPKLDEDVRHEYKNTDRYKLHHSRTHNGYEIFDFPNKAPLFQDQISKAYIIFTRIDRNSFSYKLPVTVKLYYSTDVKEKSFDLMEIVRKKGYTEDRFSR
jgi:hypothetical protein